MSTAPTHHCPSCGHTMYFAIKTATVEVAFLVGCPGCGTAMDRLDALGEVERELRGDDAPLNLRAAIDK